MAQKNVVSHLLPYVRCLRSVRAAELAASSSILLFPNIFAALIVAGRARTSHPGEPWQEGGLAWAVGLDIYFFSLWFLGNAVLIVFLIVLKRYVLSPLVAIIRQLYALYTTLHHEMPHTGHPLEDIHTLAEEIGKMTQHVQAEYAKHYSTAHALNETRESLDEISAQHETMLATTSRELLGQYESVLAYANYLEEQIHRKAADAALRYDFDDVSESSFNLKLIAGAMQMLQRAHAPACRPTQPAQLITLTLPVLTPSLDRRAMTFTTSEVDASVTAYSNPAMIHHVLWMMLLGTIRYAADESALRVRCAYNHDQTEAVVSILVSELSPGRLSRIEHEQWLAHHAHSQTPEQFAETVRAHANMQLARMLMLRLSGELRILPLTNYSCEICLTLPANASPQAI